MSIAPTLRILRCKSRALTHPRFVPAQSEPERIGKAVFAELHLLAIVPLPAVLRARGIGA